MMYQIKCTQFIKTDIQTCWDFFSSPDNLQQITPEKLRFKVLTKQPKKMYEGLFIRYDVAPILGIPMEWITEITHIKEGVFFVDEQRKGPYKIWHHEHHFEEVLGGVNMTDIVSYVVPYGWLGKIAHCLIIKGQLKTIFDYRFNKVEELFNS